MSHREHLAFLQSMGVELDFDQHGATELEMYQTLLQYQDMKLKKMEKLLSQFQAELEDNARFRLSWIAGARAQTTGLESIRDKSEGGD